MSHEVRTLLPSVAEMKNAIANRDRAYDETFVYGVITTGVFCLPSCAARPARPENLRFFLESQQAIDAGLRACKRCRPLVALAERAQLIELARYIQSNAADTLTLASLAKRVGMSTSRLQKSFADTLGVSPKAYQDAARLKGFKAALHDGAGVAQAIFDAGYGSTSRVYGEAARSVGMTPSAYRAGGAGETIYYAQRQSALGWLMMAATAQGVCFAQFDDSPARLLVQLKSEFPHAEIVRSCAQNSVALDDWTKALDAHLSDAAPRPDLPMDLRGTAFQIKVWRYLLSVPEGDVISYGELAAGIQQPTAVRAAASACGANRIAVLIPCHRVLRGDGGLGGYRWGVARKRALIEVERQRKATV